MLGRLSLSLPISFSCSRSCVPFRYEAHYGITIGRKKNVEDKDAAKKSGHVKAKINGRKASAPLDPKLEEQFNTGRLYGKFVRIYSCVFFVFLATKKRFAF